jgi:hypothetical protein
MFKIISNGNTKPYTRKDAKIPRTSMLQLLEIYNKYIVENTYSVIHFNIIYLKFKDDVIGLMYNNLEFYFIPESYNAKVHTPNKTLLYDPDEINTAINKYTVKNTIKDEANYYYYKHFIYPLFIQQLLSHMKIEDITTKSSVKDLFAFVNETKDIDLSVNILLPCMTNVEFPHCKGNKLLITHEDFDNCWTAFENDRNNEIKMLILTSQVYNIVIKNKYKFSHKPHETIFITKEVE